MDFIIHVPILKVLTTQHFFMFPVALINSPTGCRLQIYIVYFLLSEYVELRGDAEQSFMNI